MVGLDRAELAARVKDPADLPRFERFYRAMDRRLTKLGPDADAAATIRETMACWRNVFGVNWPATKPAPVMRQRRRVQVGTAIGFGA